MSTTITNLTSEKARQFFLKNESYCRTDFPDYIDFTDLLGQLNTALATTHLAGLHTKNRRPDDIEGVNYISIMNKDGGYDWRPLQLTHPVLYVLLVQEITEETGWNHIQERFKAFADNQSIECHSIPVQASSDCWDVVALPPSRPQNPFDILSRQENKSDRNIKPVSHKPFRLPSRRGTDTTATILNWWENIEQRSLELALEYNWMIHTDITNCYSSIYTHTISWALHTRPTAQKKGNDSSLLGNRIERLLRAMTQGKNIGIPQGSILMDFIAETILGYVDTCLTAGIEQTNPGMKYKILRFRDDYRIFAKNKQTAETVLQLLGQVLIDFGMKLNPTKTHGSANIIQSSIKTAKYEWLIRANFEPKTNSLFSHLLLIHKFSKDFPNAGILKTQLSRFLQALEQKKNTSNKNLTIYIGIVVDTIRLNPGCFIVGIGVISYLLKRLDSREAAKNIAQQVVAKLSGMPNSSMLELWIQRLIIKLDIPYDYISPICKLVENRSSTSDQAGQLWDSSWIKVKEIRQILQNAKLIREERISTFMKKSEFLLFMNETHYQHSALDDHSDEQQYNDECLRIKSFIELRNKLMNKPIE